MKKKSKSILTTLAVATLIMVPLFNAHAASDKVSQVFIHEGKEYRAIPSEQTVPDNNAIEQKYDQLQIIEEMKIIDDRENLKKTVNNLFPEIYGGIYTDDSGNNVILLTDHNPEIEKKLKESSSRADKVRIQTVSHTEKQLNDAHNKLYTMTDMGIVLLATDTKLNKVKVYISANELEKNKEKIIESVDESLIHWEVGEFKYVKETAYLYPGEEINFTEGSEPLTCSVGFNASTSNNSKVTVTAGHCGNNTYYDLSDQTGSIGTMSNATFGFGFNYDAGFIALNSSALTSPYLSGNTLTIGTFDWNGSGQAQGTTVYLHARSGGGTSLGSSTIQNSSISIPGEETDLVLTSHVGNVEGDSGGLWYRIINKDGKNYAVIEGIHTGTVRDNNNGQIVGASFSKFANVYNGLGLNGVFVDPNY
ncbi:hypothetical protein [Paenibacillus sp. GCM10012303]|uniref:hypothetical protein n=1 Tax=Paenibacillus sp. GCM10012303 TaxID=3317340 RepID=UPI003614EB7E